MVALGIPHKQLDQSSSINDIECGIPDIVQNDRNSDAVSNNNQVHLDRPNNVIHTETARSERCKMNSTTRCLIIGITLFAILLFSLIYVPQTTGGYVSKSQASTSSHNLLIHHTSHFPGHHG